jgi:hypothetical protein
MGVKGMTNLLLFTLCILNILFKFNFATKKATHDFVLLEQGRPTRDPRAIFGPPNLFEWPGKLVQFDHINRVKTLTVITLSSTLCIHYKL